MLDQRVPRGSEVTGPSARRPSAPRAGWQAASDRAQGRLSRIWHNSRPFLRPCLTGAKYLTPLVVLFLLALGGGYVRLLFGPISLKAMAAPIAASIAAELPGYAVTIEDALVRLNEKRQLEFRLRNVRVLDEEGNTLALAPLAALEPSFDALWRGRLSPSKVVLIEPRMLVSYSPHGGLSFSFARPEPPDGKGTQTGDPPRASAEPASDASPDRLPVALRRVDVARALAESAAHARSGADATSFLREVGLRDAILVIEQGQRNTVWRIPAAEFKLRHQRVRSAMAGSITVASERGPWTLDFRAQASEQTQQVALRLSVRDLVPRTVAGALPWLAPLQPFNLPATGEAAIELTSEGTLLGGRLSFDVSRGDVRLPWYGELPFAIEGGRVELKYDPAEGILRVLPSTLAWGQSRITIAGNISSAGEETILFDLAATEGRFVAEEFGLPPLALDRWAAKGAVNLETGAMELAEYAIRAGGGEVRIGGEVGGAMPSAGVRLHGRVGAMSVATLKTIWPRGLAPGARQWIGTHVPSGRVLGGEFEVRADGDSAASGAKSNPAVDLSMSIDVADVLVRPWPGLPPIEFPAGSIRAQGSTIDVIAPEATATLAGGRRLAFKSAAFAATDVASDLPSGRISFQVQGAAATVLEVLEHEELGIGKLVGLPRDTIEGKIEGRVTVGLPLRARVNPGEVKIEAQARLTDGRVRQLFGPHGAQAATLAFDVTDRAMDARGDLLIAGVPVKLAWQRIFDAPPEKQPPLRLTATLDNADRAQLGIDSSKVVQGEVPVEVTVSRDAQDREQVHVSADLTRADLVLENIAWRKPPGRSALLQFDVTAGSRHKTELQNFRVVGDDIAIEGWVGLDAQYRMREFAFPDFSVNLVTRLDIQGALRNDNVWDIRARGQTYDGREFFRTLFSVGEIGERPRPVRKDQPGLDLKADIDTVLGFSEVSWRGVSLQLSKRGGKLTRLEGKGTLEGGKNLEVGLVQRGKERRLVAVSDDAGQAFRLVDFYPNVQGGRMRLDVNLEGRGPAEKTGLLAVERFRLLGDPVVSEVLQFPDETGRVPDGPRARRVVREAIDFDWMRMPFSVGYGQFVVNDAELRGGLLGATFQGKADFNARTVNLGGTYVPLQGLNSAIGVIPGLGQLLAGPKGEGILGITFAIQGPMDRPQVLVNPLSLVAPGIFREMFQLTPGQSVTPPRGEAPRSRSSAPARGEPEVLTGWSSETTPSEPAATEPARSDTPKKK